MAENQRASNPTVCKSPHVLVEGHKFPLSIMLLILSQVATYYSAPKQSL